MSDFMKKRNALHQHFHETMPGVARNFDDLLKEVYKDGALSSQFKELIALGCSVAIRCEPCMHYHIEAARRKGATEEQLTEALGVGFEMAAGSVLPPLRRVLQEEFPSDRK